MRLLSLRILVDATQYLLAKFMPQFFYLNSVFFADLHVNNFKGQQKASLGPIFMTLNFLTKDLVPAVARLPILQPAPV